MSKRGRVEAILQNGNTFHLPRHDAAEMVRVGAATWKDSCYSQIQVSQKAAFVVRGLSCRIGAALAEAYYRKEGWAVVAVMQIGLRHGAPETAQID